MLHQHYIPGRHETPTWFYDAVEPDGSITHHRLHILKPGRSAQYVEVSRILEKKNGYAIAVITLAPLYCTVPQNDPTYCNNSIYTYIRTSYICTQRIRNGPPCLASHCICMSDMDGWMDGFMQPAHLPDRSGTAQTLGTNHNVT